MALHRGCVGLLYRGGANAGFEACTFGKPNHGGIGVSSAVSDGDEIQMIIITFGILGDGKTVEEGVTMAGTISPTGYGEGYAAADRYRLNGHPMLRGQTRQTPDPSTVALTPFPEDERDSGSPTGGTEGSC